MLSKYICDASGEETSSSPHSPPERGHAVRTGCCSMLLAGGRTCLQAAWQLRLIGCSLVRDAGTPAIEAAGSVELMCSPRSDDRQALVTFSTTSGQIFPGQAMHVNVMCMPTG